jgi:hypothetical protein
MAGTINFTANHTNESRMRNKEQSTEIVPEGLLHDYSTIVGPSLRASCRVLVVASGAVDVAPSSPSLSYLVARAQWCHHCTVIVVVVACIAS